MIKGKNDIMSLFKKKKIETIDLPEIKDVIEEIPFSLFTSSEVKTPLLKNQDLIDAFKKWQNEYDKISKLYYFCKIYSPVATFNSDLEKQLIGANKYFDHLTSLHNQVGEAIFQLKEEENQEYLNTLLNKLQEMYLTQDSFHNLLAEIKKYYYSKIKIATLNVCLDKEILELQTTEQEMKKFLRNYKTLEEAAQYIYYNSGIIIQKLITDIVNRLKQTKNQRYIQLYTNLYFLKSDAVITLNLSEWVELYNKLKFVVKNTPEANLLSYNSLKSEFILFEISYLILMINSERR